MDYRKPFAQTQMLGNISTNSGGMIEYDIAMWRKVIHRIEYNELVYRSKNPNYPELRIGYGRPLEEKADLQKELLNLDKRKEDAWLSKTLKTIHKEVRANNPSAPVSAVLEIVLQEFNSRYQKPQFMYD